MIGEEEKMIEQGTIHVLYYFQLGELVFKLLRRHDPEVTQTLSASSYWPRNTDGIKQEGGGIGRRCQDLQAAWHTVAVYCFLDRDPVVDARIAFWFVPNLIYVATGLFF